MTVMESLASSKDHIEEAAQSYFGVATFAQRFVPLYRNPPINFSFRCSEDGVFDHKGCSENLCLVW